MKILLGILIVMLAALQYRLWFGDGSAQEVWRLNNESKAAQAELLRLRSRNQALEAEVADLKSGLDAIEERARSELGMIDEDETFYQFVRERRANVNRVNTLELQSTASTAEKTATSPQQSGRQLIDRSTAPANDDVATETAQ